MKALVIKPKNSSELKFISSLLKKLGIDSSSVNQEELEDVGLSKLMRQVDKTKKASRAEIMKKLTS
jgi:reverse gyrase